MKTITLKLDRQVKIILTVIAIALIVIALKPFLPTELQAYSQIVDVNIKKVGGYSTYGTLDVEVSNEVEINGTVDVNIEQVGGYWTYGTLDVSGEIEVSNYYMFGE